MLGNLHPLARVLRRGTALVAPFGLLAPFAALANPSGADVIHGDVSFSSPGPGGLVIDQTSHNAIINWQQFSIGNGEYVRFNQPSASSAVLNRVIGGNPSEILGNLSANGRVFLINPQGVMFGVGSRIDVGSLAVSTHDIADRDFIDGRYVFAGSSNAGIHNEGEIKAADGGFVVLAADQVRNSGLIQAHLGEVVLAAGGGMRFELDTGGLVSFQIDAEAASSAAGVENLGDIVAAGGNILLSAKVARDLASSAVNNSGRVVATGVEERDGAIYLVAQGGDIANSGLLDVSGGQRGVVGLYSDGDITLAQGSQIRANGGDGGYVRAVAEQNLLHAEGSTIDVSADTGADTGGFLELSGHEHLAVRGDITLGDKGQLVLDPSLLIVGDHVNDTVSFAYLENLLQTNVGAMVKLVASEQIIVREREGAQTLNGRNTDGEGAGLFLGIGTMETYGTCDGYCVNGAGFAPMASSGTATFVQGTGSIKIGSEGGDDTLDIAGDIVLWASDYYNYSDTTPLSEIAVYANLKSGGGVSLRALGDILTQDIQASGIPRSSYGLPGISLYEPTIGDSPLYPGTGIELRSLEGAIRTGSLNAPWISLTAANGILVTGNVTAASESGSAFVDLWNDGETGDIEVQGDVLVSSTFTPSEQNPYFEQSDTAFYASGNGKVTVGGDITVTATGNRAVVDLNGLEDISIAGDVRVEGGAITQGYPRDTVANIFLNSEAGDVTVDGTLTVKATAGEYSMEGGYDYYSSLSDGGYSTSRIDGGASVEVNGHNITLGGLDVTGTGLSEVILTAHPSSQDEPGKVTITGQTTVTALAGQSTETYPPYEGTRDRLVRHYGTAELIIDAEDGEIETNGISVSGPNAIVDLYAGQLTLNAGAEGAPALQVVAGATADQRARLEAVSISEETEEEFVYLSSDVGTAVATLWASRPDGDIDVGGSVEVKGPSAALLISASGNTDVAGDLRVEGTGYQIQGDWMLLSDYQDHSPGYYSLLDPSLESGTSNWGGATLLMGAVNGDESPGGTIRIGGNLSVSGVGDAFALIGSNGLTVEGEQGITVSASLGSLNGIRSDWNSESQQYQPIHMGGEIDGQGNIEGEARFGSATFVMAGNPNGQAHLRAQGGLKLEGGTTRAAVMFTHAVELGSLQLLGGVGEQAPRYAERLDEGNSQISSTWTHIVGGLNSALIDVGPQGSLTIDGPVTVSGTGIASLELFGGTVSLGDVTVDGSSGEYYQGTQSSFESAGFGGVVVQLLADSGVATADSLVIRGTNAHLGVDVEVSGDVTIDVSGVLDNVVPAAIAGFTNPLDLFSDGSQEPGDVVLEESRIHARNIDFSFGSEARLDTLALHASDLLKLDGNGISLQLDGLGESLSGSSLELVNLTLYGGQLELDVENNLTLRNSQLNYGTGLLKAGGELLLQDSGLFGDSHTLQASTIRMDNSTLSAGEGGADTVTLTASLIEVLGDSLIDADTLDFSGDALRIDDATLTGDLDARFTDSISISNANLSGETASLHQTGREGGGETDGQAGISIHNSTLDYDTLELDAAGPISLGGILRADQLSLRSDGAILQGSETSLLIEAGALDAIGEVIDLSNSTISIGTGTAVNGADASLFDQIPTALRPGSSAPNASFIASGAQGVSIGTITLEGGYLYVQAARASTEQINAPGRLLYNYRPYDDNGLIALPQVSNLSIEAAGTTLVYGGTGYAGDVTILNPRNATAKSSPSQDYVFLTGGTIYGSQSINTSGQVLVLGGTLVDPQSGEHPLEEVADALVVTSHLAPEPKPSEEQEIFHTDLIDEQSTSAMVVEEFQCR